MLKQTPDLHRNQHTETGKTETTTYTRKTYTDEVNYCGLTSTTERVTTEDTYILTVESITEAKVLLTMEESTSWPLDSDAFYHVTPLRS